MYQTTEVPYIVHIIRTQGRKSTCIRKLYTFEGAKIKTGTKIGEEKVHIRILFLVHHHSIINGRPLHDLIE